MKSELSRCSDLFNETKWRTRQSFSEVEISIRDEIRHELANGQPLQCNLIWAENRHVICHEHEYRPSVFNARTPLFPTGPTLQIKENQSDSIISLWLFHVLLTTFLCVTLLFLLWWSQVLLATVFSSTRWRGAAAGSCSFLNSSAAWHTAVSPFRPVRKVTGYG